MSIKLQIKSMPLAEKTFRKTFNSVIALKAKEKVRPSPDAPEAKI